VASPGVQSKPAIATADPQKLDSFKDYSMQTLALKFQTEFMTHAY
jgi:hypothetical protein